MSSEVLTTLISAYISCYSTLAQEPTDVPVALAPASESQVARTELIIRKKLPLLYRDLLLLSNGLKSGNFYHFYSTDLLESSHGESSNTTAMQEILDVAPFPRGIKLAHVILLSGSVRNMTMSFIVAEPKSREHGRVLQWQMGIWGDYESLPQYLKSHVETLCPNLGGVS